MTTNEVNEIESPYWNIFEPPIENNSTESYEYVEYRRSMLRLNR